MEVRQGDVFWIDLDEPRGSEPGFTRPFVVVQNNVFNRSRINTVLVCALTTNTSRANAPGNVVLKKGEANLPKGSVVVVSQALAVDRRDLRDRVGTLSKDRIDEIIAGIKLLIEPREIDEKE
ncbi:MAG TPA: type II toxin-antitoxin system PemK/MazF family toxin [Pyrinomonadaceae bacterium]